MKVSRSVIGVSWGFLVFFLIMRMMTSFSGNLTEASPAGYLLIDLAGTIAGGILAGYLAARIAGAHEFPHAAAVGFWMIVMSYVSMRQEGASRPGWYEIALGGCGPISAMIGAAIRMLTKPRKARRQATANTKVSKVAIRP